MWLAGMPIADNQLVELVARLRAAETTTTANRLERTLDRGARIVALDITDREAILRILEECPDDLAELRAILLQEHEWRRGEGF